MTRSPRTCPECSATLAPTKRRDATFCGADCRETVKRRRRQALIEAGRAALAHT